MNLDVGPVVDILQTGPVDADPAPSRCATALRRAGPPVTVAVLALAAAVSAGHPGASGGSAASPARPATSVPAPVAGPRLVVPRQAHPGERLIVLAYRNRRLCGSAHLRLDGGAVPHAVVRDLGPAGTDRTALIMTVDLPRTIRAGRHVVQLYGPTPGGRGPLCADVPEHQGQVAEAAVTVSRR